MPQEKCATRKCVRRNRTRVGKRVLVAAALLLLLAGPRLVGSQSNSSAAPATPHAASPAVPAKANTLPLDGLKLTDDQKTRIAEIRRHVEARREAIIKNEALNQDRKETILQRLNLIETSEIFRVLTPDQQKEVQKWIADRRASKQQEPASEQTYGDRVTSKCASNTCRTLARTPSLVAVSSLIFLSSQNSASRSCRHSLHASRQLPKNPAPDGSVQVVSRVFGKCIQFSRESRVPTKRETKVQGITA